MGVERVGYTPHRDAVKKTPFLISRWKPRQPCRNRHPQLADMRREQTNLKDDVKVMMKQSSNSRRSRGRSVGKRQPKNSNFDSNGPEVRVRGSAQQVYEKYLTLARDALTIDDRISSENYFQHAEHYFRILGAQETSENRDGGRDNNRDNKRDGGRNQRGRGPQQQGNQPEEAAADGANPAPVPAEQPVVSDLAGAEQPSVEMPAHTGDTASVQSIQPAPEPTQEPMPEPEPEPEQTEATVERTGAAAIAEASAAGDSDTDETPDDDDGPLDSAVA
jgi:hypothetical protein